MADAASPARKRRRGGGGLERVAEIVMVLAAAGEMRGGREPTAAERALAAEARERLADAVGDGAVRPKDLFSREAVCAVVEDLGLNRSRDAASMGFRLPKASIAERLVLTKRKMEEVKEAPVHSTTYSPQTIVSNPMAEFQGSHGTPMFSVAVPQNLPVVASLPAATQVASTSPAFKQPRLNETPTGMSPVKPPSLPSVVALPHSAAPHLRLDKGASGPPYLPQSGATTGQANKSAHPATSSSVNAVQSSNQVVRNQQTRIPAVQAVTGNLIRGQQAPPTLGFVNPQPIFANHNDIAKNVQQFLLQPSNHPSWTPPSTEYMRSRLECQICKGVIVDVDSLLVCDACERGAHLKCLQHYGNKGIPKAEWHCPTCLAQSKGKPLPPKYGKVTRTIVAPKAAPAGGSTRPSPPTKHGQQKEAANGNIIKANSTQASSIAHNIGVLALNARTAGSEAQSVSTSEPVKENVDHAEALSNQNEGNGPMCSSIDPEGVKSLDESQSSEMPSCSATGTQSEKNTKQTESSSRTVNSANDDSVLQSTEKSGTMFPDYSCGVAYEEIHTTEASSQPHPVSEKEATDSITKPMDRTHQVNGATFHEVKDPCNKEVSEEKVGIDTLLDHERTGQANSNGILCPKDEIVGCGAAHGVVDWVGDALKIIDGKAYYDSCNINGLSYKLQDNVLIASKDGKFAPSKLQSLWEEHESGSKLAIVEPYCFASDIPESISRPCDAEENELYASNNQRTIMACAICGPCQVLGVDKYREESKRRSQLVNSDSSLHPIFFCRWKYDESTNSFDSIIS